MKPQPFLIGLLVLLPAGAVLPALAPAQTLADVRAKAERGDRVAQKELADSLFAREEEANAISWLRKSANGDYAGAQDDLGWRYLLGRGVPKDLAQARTWFRKAAAQGLGSAWVNLCHSYREPMALMKGVDPPESWPLPPVTGNQRDLAELLESCRKGATTGSAAATNVLGVLYARGIGDMKPDYEQAYFWLRVRVTGPRELRRKIREILPADKRLEIEARARTWKPTMPYRPG